MGLGRDKKELEKEKCDRKAPDQEKSSAPKPQSKNHDNKKVPWYSKLHHDLKKLNNFNLKKTHQSKNSHQF